MHDGLLVASSPMNEECPLHSPWTDAGGVKETTRAVGMDAQGAPGRCQTSGHMGHVRHCHGHATSPGRVAACVSSCVDTKRRILSTTASQCSLDRLCWSVIHETHQHTHRTQVSQSAPDTRQGKLRALPIYPRFGGATPQLSSPHTRTKGEGSVHWRTPPPVLQTPLSFVCLVSRSPCLPKPCVRACLPCVSFPQGPGWFSHEGLTRL